MAKTWRVAVVVMLLVAGSIGSVAAQGKGNGGGGGNTGGGPGSGGICPTGSADVVLDPGHGQHTGASTTYNDEPLWEDDLNLEIAELTARLPATILCRAHAI